jgi:hypothetical protein
VKVSANFRDWSIRYHSRNRTFAVNERNANNKSLKENVEKTTKTRKIFQIVGMDDMEQMKQRVLSCFLDSRASRKGHPPRACCGAPGECLLVLEDDECFLEGISCGPSTVEKKMAHRTKPAESLLLLHRGHRIWAMMTSSEFRPRIASLPNLVTLEYETAFSWSTATSL